MKILLILLFALPLCASAQTITIKAKLNAAPNATTHLVKADLKYNKFGVFNMEWDDRAATALGATGYTIMSAKTFTDGCGNNIPFRCAVAVNSKTNDSTADYSTIGGSLTYSQLATLVNADWALEDHSFSHDPTYTFSSLQSAIRNRQFIYEQMSAAGAPFVLRTGVVPGAYTKFNQAWDALRYLAGTSQNVFDTYNAFPNADWMGHVDISGFKDLPTFKTFARRFNDTWNSSTETEYEGYINSFITASTSSNKQLMRLGSHTTDATYFPAVISYLQANAADKIWVCSLQELMEYFEVQQRSRIKQSISADTLIVTIDQSDVPENNRWRDMSFTLSSNVSLSNVTVTGADSYSFNTSTGLINVFKKKTTGFANPITYNDGTGAATTGVVPLSSINLTIDNSTSLNCDWLIDGNLTATQDFGTNFIYTPAEIVIDLMDYQPCYASTFDMHDVADAIGNGKVHVIQVNAATGAEHDLGQYTFNDDTWHSFTADNNYSTSKFILRQDTSALFGNVWGTEIRVNATYKPYTAPSVSRTYYPLKNFSGYNTYVYDPCIGSSLNAEIVENRLAAMLSVKPYGVRFYMDQEQIIPGNTADSFAFNRTISAFQYDTVFKRFSQNNVKAWPVVMNVNRPQLRTWQTAGVTQSSNPYYYADRLTKGAYATYDDVGHMAYVNALRYGSNNTGEDYHIWNGNYPNTRQKGLNYLTRAEHINEWDAAWSNINTYTRGRDEFYAQSLVYDGAKGKYAYRGAKQADKDIEVILGGMGVARIDALTEMAGKARELRGYHGNGSIDLPFDAINYHKYSSDAYFQGASTIGLPPEASDFNLMLDKYLSWRDKYAPGMKGIVTEYGWDMNASSTLYAKPVGSYTSEEVIGIWTLRAMAHMAAKGMAEATYYNVFPENVANSTNYASMGIINSTTLARYPVGDYMRQLVENYGDYVYDSTISTNPYVYRFKKGADVMYMCFRTETVSPNGSGSYNITENVSNYSLSLPGNPSIAIKQFATGADDMSVSTANVSGGAYTISNLGMKPVVVEVLSNVPGRRLKIKAGKRIRFVMN